MIFSAVAEKKEAGGKYYYYLFQEAIQTAWVKSAFAENIPTSGDGYYYYKNLCSINGREKLKLFFEQMSDETYEEILTSDMSI